MNRWRGGKGYRVEKVLRASIPHRLTKLWAQKRWISAGGGGKDYRVEKLLRAPIPHRLTKTLGSEKVNLWRGGKGYRVEKVLRAPIPHKVWLKLRAQKRWIGGEGVRATALKRLIDRRILWSHAHRGTFNEWPVKYCDRRHTGSRTFYGFGPRGFVQSVKSCSRLWQT